MSQLHFYVPDTVEQALRTKAAEAGQPLSRFVAEVSREIATTWPEDFTNNVLGGWQGNPLGQTAQGDYESRTELTTS